jgi:hypothetical protein
MKITSSHTMVRATIADYDIIRIHPVKSVSWGPYTNVKNRTVRNLDHLFEAAKVVEGLKAPLRRRPVACQV